MGHFQEIIIETYYMPGSVLDAGARVVNVNQKQNNMPEGTFVIEERQTISIQIIKYAVCQVERIKCY